ncbi:MAG TPA: CBS domain-containing protein [Phycisphaerae bacterium]|nr:CBS domain-containing protein [Phycisphaerae bacterium]
MSTVASILAEKSARIHAINPEASVLEATQKMNRHRIGSLIVMQGDNFVGILSERDILMRVVAEEKEPRNVRVYDVMTTEVICCPPETTLEEASAIMMSHRVRHLPVCDAEGRMVGLVSIGDLNARHASEQEIVIHHLHEYIYGRV